MRRPDDLARHGSRHCCTTSTSPRSRERSGGSGSPGVDRVTVDDYEQDLEANLRDLHQRSGQYWPQPVRRTYIPKTDGSRRALGIATLEDKIVQGAVAEVLAAVYDFLGFSHGFRPGRSPHWLPWTKP